MKNVFKQECNRTGSRIFPNVNLKGANCLLANLPDWQRHSALWSSARCTFWAFSYSLTSHLQQAASPPTFTSHIPMTTIRLHSPHLHLSGPLMHAHKHTPLVNPPSKCIVTPQKGLLQWVKWVPDVPLQPPQRNGRVCIGYVCARGLGGGVLF